MVPHLFFYPLVLFALIWLFIILRLTWPKPGVTAPAVPAEPKPLKPKRHRSNEPKAFEGLTKKPPCALCERDTAHPQPPCPVPPAPMPAPHRRPRQTGPTDCLLQCGNKRLCRLGVTPSMSTLGSQMLEAPFCLYAACLLIKIRHTGHSRLIPHQWKGCLGPVWTARG
jgi:hypothetical protein